MIADRSAGVTTTGPTIGVLRESAPGERRVALVPEVLTRISGLVGGVVIESGAGDRAWFSDDAYERAGFEIADADSVHERADILLRVGPPSTEQMEKMRDGRTHAGLLRPLERPQEVQSWAERGITTVCLDLLPRTLSRAQTLDALTSQSSVAGYRAVLRAADTFPGWFPMLMTAAGTVKPAEVLVLGTGVAGLQAIATARRLGAKVSAYDIRPASKDEVTSLGARFVELPGVADGGGSGGYARVLTDEEQHAQRVALDTFIARADVVITTAQVPGRRPPQLVSAEAVAAMRPGSVIVDIASSTYGGNVAVSQPDQTVVVDGVTVIGAGNLPSEMPTAASTAYARNMVALLGLLVVDGALRVDLADEVQAGIVVTHDGAVVSAAVRALL